MPILESLAIILTCIFCYCFTIHHIRYDRENVTRTYRATNPPEETITYETVRLGRAGSVPNMNRGIAAVMGSGIEEGAPRMEMMPENTHQIKTWRNFIMTMMGRAFGWADGRTASG